MAMQTQSCEPVQDSSWLKDSFQTWMPVCHRSFHEISAFAVPPKPLTLELHSGPANCIDDRSGFRNVSSAANNSLGHNFHGSDSIVNVTNCAAFECIPLPISVSSCLLRPSTVILVQLFHSHQCPRRPPPLTHALSHKDLDQR